MKRATLYSSLLTFFLFTNVSSVARAQNCQPSRDLPNFGCVNSNFFRGAQPTEEGIKELARRGVKTVINLRGADEKARTEEVWARNAGIKFISVPLSDWFAPKSSKMEEILAMIDAPENQPVFVHCKRGADRTGTVVAAYRISRDGWTAKQAQSEANDYGFGWWQIWKRNYINDYYGNYENGNSRKSKIDFSPKEKSIFRLPYLRLFKSNLSLESKTV